MQVMPATGRQLARRLGIRNFTTSRLTDPELNIKLGTVYFSQLVSQFGGTYYALARYNAGENRVARWKRERPGLEEDEFIDHIAFPERQNYVKRMLGTAEDYRMLYGSRAAAPRRPPTAAASKPPVQAAAPSTRKSRPSKAKKPVKKAPPKKAPPKKAPPKKTT